MVFTSQILAKLMLPPPFKRMLSGRFWLVYGKFNNEASDTGGVINSGCNVTLLITFSQLMNPSTTTISYNNPLYGLITLGLPAAAKGSGFLIHAYNN